jgi:hypothetical protein
MNQSDYQLNGLDLCGYSWLGLNRLHNYLAVRITPASRLTLALIRFNHWSAFGTK